MKNQQFLTPLGTQRHLFKHSSIKLRKQMKFQIPATNLYLPNKLWEPHTHSFSILACIFFSAKHGTAKPTTKNIERRSKIIFCELNNRYASNNKPPNALVSTPILCVSKTSQHNKQPQWQHFQPTHSHRLQSPIFLCRS